MTQEQRVTILPNDAIERIRNRLYRKSHSWNTVRLFNNAVKKLEAYMDEKNLDYGDFIKSPIQSLDDFATWFDGLGYSAGTIRPYVYYVKKLLKVMGAEINIEDFKESIVLPKKRTFQDDKVSEEQIRRIVLACKNERLKVLLMLIKDTQARPGELLGLKLGDINLTYDPPYLAIPTHLAKNDEPREVFFTPETKAVLMSYLENNGIKNANDYVFLTGTVDEVDEKAFQKKLAMTSDYMRNCFRRLISKPEFVDLNVAVQQRGKMTRYKYHPYSFKKFAFTKAVDTLGEIPARAMKGDREYVQTYYKKSREERAEDYRKLIPKLSVFGMDEKSKLREQVEEAIKSVKEDGELAAVLEFVRNGKKVARK